MQKTKLKAKESLKIIGLQVDGLRKLKAINMQFQETGLTQIIGPNEQGKTTILDALQILIRGNKYANKNIITAGKQKAILVGQIGKYKVHREIPIQGSPTLKVTNTETGEVSKGRVQDFLDTFINELTANPRPFLDKTKLEKLKFLMELTGLDFTEIDAELKKHYDIRLALGQEIDRYGGIIVPKKVTRVNISDLTAEKKEIYMKNAVSQSEYELKRQAELEEIGLFNKEQREKARIISVAEVCYKEVCEDVNGYKADIKELEEKLAVAKRNLAICEKSKANDEEENKSLPIPLPEKDLVSTVPIPELLSTTEIDEKIEKAAEVNQLAIEYENQQMRYNDKTKKEFEYSDLTEKIDTLRKKKLEILAGTDTGVEGLTITEEDIFYNGISSENWSDAQGLTISCELCIAQMPTLRAVFLDRAESLDRKTLSEFVEWGVKNDIQIIITKVVDDIPETKEDGVFYIYDGSFVEIEEDK